MKSRPFTVKTKLILRLLIVTVFGGILSLSFGSRFVKNTLISQAQAKIRHNLRFCLDGL